MKYILCPTIGQRKGLSNCLPNGMRVQIDNLIMRRDNVRTIIEYKYTKKPICKQIIDDVSKKIEKLSVPRQISVEKVLVSACGVTEPVAQSGYFDHILTISDILA